VGASSTVLEPVLALEVADGLDSLRKVSEHGVEFSGGVHRFASVRDSCATVRCLTVRF
jgi:hypothetical protein